MLAKRLGILTVVRGLDVVEFGGIRNRTLRCTELRPLGVRDVFWQRSACVVGMTSCSAMNNTDVSGGIMPYLHVPGIFYYESRGIGLLRKLTIYQSTRHHSQET